jgi:hypothetical protein
MNGRCIRRWQGLGSDDRVAQVSRRFVTRNLGSRFAAMVKGVDGGEAKCVAGSRSSGSAWHRAAISEAWLPSN